LGAGSIKFKNAEEAAEYLIVNAAILTVPWDDVGAYLRFSVTFEAFDQDDEFVIKEVRDRLKSLNLFFE